MKRILSMVTCFVLAGCACNDANWENLDNVTFEEVVYDQNPQVIAEPAPVYVEVPQVVQDCPCSEVAQTSCYTPCACQTMPKPEPKIIKTKKIITTTTTYEEPCGKPVCEPVVTVHEEFVPYEGSEPVVITPASEPVNDKTPVAEVSQKELAPIMVETKEIVEPKAPIMVEVKEETEAKAPVAKEEGGAVENKVEVIVEKSPYHAKVVDIRKPDAKVNLGTTVKYSPEAYIVVATRATNRMLQDTSAIYDGASKKIYIKDINLLSSDLPYGGHRLKGATKEIISGSNTFEVVNNIKDADFVVEPTADWYVSSNSDVPALQYTMKLLDKNGNKIDEWIEVIRQVKE